MAGQFSNLFNEHLIVYFVFHIIRTTVCLFQIYLVSQHKISIEKDLNVFIPFKSVLGIKDWRFFQRFENVIDSTPNFGLVICNM